MRSPDDGQGLVVLAEEDITQRREIVRYLQEHDFRVLEAADADEAMALLRSRPDVQAFVTDAHLPGKHDSYELARVVRVRWPAVAVVMMSGHSDASSGPVTEGADFITKPYLFEHLAHTLSRMIGGDE
jgi:DNA-binding NtrC family response regulator